MEHSSDTPNKFSTIFRGSTGSCAAAERISHVLACPQPHCALGFGQQRWWQPARPCCLEKGSATNAIQRCHLVPARDHRESSPSCRDSNKGISSSQENTEERIFPCASPRDPAGRQCLENHCEYQAVLPEEPCKG